MPGGGLEPALSLSPVPRKTCSSWFESGCRVNCGESPGALWAHKGTAAQAGAPGSSPGVSGDDGGEIGSQNVNERTDFIH